MNGPTQVHRVDEFVDYLNQSSLLSIPDTFVVWCGEICIPPVELGIPVPLRALLSAAEMEDAIREVTTFAIENLKLSHGPVTAGLLAYKSFRSRGVLKIRYEEHTSGEPHLRRYSMNRGPGNLITLNRIPGQ